MRRADESDKRVLGSPPMRICMGGPVGNRKDETLEKKRLHPKMEPYESGANGRGRRKRRLPMDQAEGGGFGFNPCRLSAGPREEDSVRRPVDTLNMCSSTASGNAAVRMSAMRCVRGRSACLTH